MSTDIDRRIAFLTAALEQANETIRSKMDELSLVRRAGDAISHHTSIWSLSSELVDAIAETVNCKYALTYTASDAGQFELQAVSSTFSSPEEFPVTIGPSGIVRHFERTGILFKIATITENPMWFEDWPLPTGLVSWVCVPLLTRNDLRGILCLADDAPGTFDERTLRRLWTASPPFA